MCAWSCPWCCAGVGGAVFDASNRVLVRQLTLLCTHMVLTLGDRDVGHGCILQVVVEKYGFDDVKRWKVPGGMVEPGESIGAAAVREVWEETGVKATFQSIALFRESTTSVPSSRGVYGGGVVYALLNKGLAPPQPLAAS